MAYIACVFYLLMPTGALTYIDRIIYGDWPGKPGNKVTQALNLLAIFFSVLLFWWGTRHRRRAMFNRVVPLAAACLLLTSVLWSVAPSTTVTRSVAYFFLVVGAFGIAEIFDSHQLMRVTAWIGGFSAAISLILPDPAIALGGTFRGPFQGKNQLGEAMVIGVLGGLHCIRAGGGRRFLYYGVTALCTTLAFLSKSGTALVTIFALVILHIIFTFYIKGGATRMISICLAIFATATFIFLMMNIDSIFIFLDKDPTLTGRTELWPYVIDYIYQRPLLGWGFTAFWIPSNPAGAEISSAVGFPLNEAHNGLLQLLLDVGIVGTTFFLFLWVRNFLLAMKCINGLASETGVSSLLLLVGILLIGVSEQVLATAGEETVYFFLLGFMCEKELRRAWQATYWSAERALHAGAGFHRNTQHHMG
jgi:exopolysaccharide production protein ExoQ